MNATTLSLLRRERKEAEEQLSDLEGRARDGCHKFIEALTESIGLLEVEYRQRIGDTSNQKT